MNLSPLLAELETKSHRDRVARMIALGRQAAAGDAEAAAQIAELGRSADAYQRQLALFSVHGSEDGARLAAGTADASRTLRRTAWRRLTRFCHDAALLAEALSGVHHLPTLKRAIARLHKAGHSEPIDRFLEPHLSGADVELVYLDLMPFGSAELVLRHLARLDLNDGNIPWARIARFHPELAVEISLGRLEGSKGLHERVHDQVRIVLHHLPARHAEIALHLYRRLLERLHPSEWFHLDCHQLIVAKPAEVFDLLRQQLERLPRHQQWPGSVFRNWRFDKIAPKLGGERLAWLVRRAADQLPDGDRGIGLFYRLGPEDRQLFLDAFLDTKPRRWGGFLFRYATPDDPRRAPAFAAWVTANRDRSGILDPFHLELLPRDLREREARRHLERQAGSTLDTDSRLVYARFLPYAEAATTLAVYLGHPEGEERAKAVRHLLGTLRFDRDAVPAALDFLRARKFEQDPYRQAACETLALLPLGVFTASHLPALEIVLNDAREAADLSPGTSAALEGLLCKLLHVDSSWAAARLVELWTTRGGTTLYDLGQRTLPPHLPALAAALEPLCQNFVRRENTSGLLRLARSFGIRLEGLPPLLAALETFATELPFASTAGEALGLLRRHAHRRFAELLPELLKKDKSYILLGESTRHLSLSRQDLLSPFLEARPMEGRFATGKTQWVLDFELGLRLWTTSQQERYSQQLLALLAICDNDTTSLRFAISRLARLPFCDPAPFLAFAADPRQPVREMVVRALPWLDAAQGVPTLIAALDDDRARWAIYALRKSFAEMPRAAALEHLRAAPLRKVTVAKEVLRLLGDFGGEAGFRELLRIEKGELHRDVRVALLRALFLHQRREETWDILRKAANDPDWILAAKVAELPTTWLPAELEEKWLDLLIVLLRRPEREARGNLLQNARSLPLNDPKRRFFGALCAHLVAAEPDESAAALAAILSRMQGAEVSQVAELLVPLIRQRRHWQKLFPVIQNYHRWSWGRENLLAKRILVELRQDLPSLPQMVQLAAQIDEPEDWIRRLAELADQELLYREVWDSAFEAISSFRHPEKLEPQLRGQKSPQLRRLGLAVLLRHAEREEGWSRSLQNKLQLYQKDRSPEVWAPATLILPPEPTET